MSTTKKSQQFNNKESKKNKEQKEKKKVEINKTNPLTPTFEQDIGKQKKKRKKIF